VADRPRPDGGAQSERDVGPAADGSDVSAAAGADGGDEVDGDGSGNLSRRDMLRRAGFAAAAAGLAAPPAPSAAPSAAASAPARQAAAPKGVAGAMDPRFMEVPPITLPPPGVGNGMNVVIVILDSLRQDHVGAYGARGVDTPALDDLARTSTMFTRAWPEAMPTVQVRRCVHTGQRTFPTRGWWPQKGGRVRMPGWQRIPEEQVTLAEILESAGYYTSFITDVPHLFHPSMNFHRGFQHWDLIRGQYNGMFRGGGADVRNREQDHQAPKVFRAAADVLGSAERLQPFFMVIDSYDPHEPWDPPTSYVTRYGEARFAGEEPTKISYGSSSVLTEAELDRVRVLYRAEVTMADAWLGKFLDDLDRRDLLDNTLVVFLSDHGVLLGEHGLIGKPVDDSLWPEITDIPLLIRHPERRAGRRDGRIVSTHDLVPTVLSALDITPPMELPGLDLTPVLAGRPNAVRRRGQLTMGYAQHAQIRTSRWALTTNSDGTRRRLYDLRAEGFARDVAAANPDVVRGLVQRIERDAGGPLPVHDPGAVIARLGERG
jgi:arylsulfatase A-like enzyme